MPPITLGTPLHSLADAFRKALADVLSETLASPWSVEIKPDDAITAEDGPPLCFALNASGSLQGNAAFQLAPSDARSLGQKLLKEPGDATSELNAQHNQAIEALLKQIAERTAATLKADYGDLTLQVSSAEAPTWPGATVLLMASAGPAGTFSVQVKFSNELVAALPAAPAEPPSPPPGEVPMVVDSNLDLLLGVDLSLTLRFGQRTLTLREILDLSSGSVIELDRRVQEPADLLLGDKLIARGEVVIVDSNYGLRITEVCDAQHQAAKGALSAAQ
jgi:flagellar motor switch protein FliN